MEKTIKISALTLSMLFVLSCNTPTKSIIFPENTLKTDNKLSASDKKNQIKEITFNLTNNVLGIESAITPKDISSVEINGKVIKGSEIVIKSAGLYTKAASDDNVVTYDQQNNRIVIKQDSDLKNIIIKFNLVNAKDPLVLNLVSQLYNDDNFKITFKDNKYIGGIDKGSGIIDENKVTFIQEGNKLIINDPVTKKQITFDTKELEKTTNVKPKDERDITTEDLLKISSDIAKNTGGLNSAIFPYVGFWKYEGFGKNIEMSFLNSSKGNYSVNLKIDGNDYIGTGTYDVNLQSIRELNFSTTFSKQNKTINISIKLSLIGFNNLNATLTSTDDPELGQYKDIPFTLSRKINGAINYETPSKPVESLKPDNVLINNGTSIDADNNGFLDNDEKCPPVIVLRQLGKPTCTPEIPYDFDLDGTPDYLDMDNDNDVLDDKYEIVSSQGIIIKNSEGIVVLSDTDGDGIPDLYDTDSDNDGVIDGNDGIYDVDHDGKPGFRDIDSNGDGINDK
jgi:hypothetical protein